MLKVIVWEQWSHTYLQIELKKLSCIQPDHCNYSQVEKKALALIFALKKFHKILFRQHFILLTVHKPLLSIFGTKRRIPVYSDSRLQVWAIILLRYDFEIQYCRTMDFGQADALSHFISSQPVPDDNTVIATVNIQDDFQHTLTLFRQFQ